MIYFCFCELPSTPNACKFNVSSTTTNKKWIRPRSIWINFESLLSFNDRMNLFYHVQDLGVFLQLHAILLSIFEIHTLNCFLKTYHFTKNQLWTKRPYSSWSTLKDVSNSSIWKLSMFSSFSKLLLNSNYSSLHCCWLLILLCGFSHHLTGCSSETFSYRSLKTIPR